MRDQVAHGLVTANAILGLVGEALALGPGAGICAFVGILGAVVEAKGVFARETFEGEKVELVAVGCFAVFANECGVGILGAVDSGGGHFHVRGFVGGGWIGRHDGGRRGASVAEEKYLCVVGEFVKVWHQGFVWKADKHTYDSQIRNMVGGEARDQGPRMRLEGEGEARLLTHHVRYPWKLRRQRQGCPCFTRRAEVLDF